MCSAVCRILRPPFVSMPTARMDCRRSTNSSNILRKPRAVIHSELFWNKFDSIFGLIQIFPSMQNNGEISGHNFVNWQIETNRSNCSDSPVDQMFNSIEQFEWRFESIDCNCHQIARIPRPLQCAWKRDSGRERAAECVFRCLWQCLQFIHRCNCSSKNFRSFADSNYGFWKMDSNFGDAAFNHQNSHRHRSHHLSLLANRLYSRKYLFPGHFFADS